VFGAPSCSINLMAVQILWALTLVVHTVCLVLSIESLYRYSTTFKRNHHDDRLYHSYGFWFAISCFTMAASMIIIGVLKIVDPEIQIGQSPVVTPFFAIGYVGFWNSSFFYLVVFLKLNAKNKRIQNAAFKQDFRKVIHILKMAIPVGIFFNTVWASFPLFMLAAPNRTVVMVLGAFHYMGAAVTLVGFRFY
jgi:hypothetical protein